MRALLERLYPNRFGDMKPGRIRYGVLTSDGGRIMDDGTIARLADDLFYVTTTSTGADAVTAWFEWWNAVWGYEAEIVNVTGALAAVNLAGPQARAALAASDDDADDVRPTPSSTSTRRRSRSPACPRSRCASASSGSSATSSTSRARPASTSGTRSSRGRAAVRPRAAAGAPPREGPRHRRPGHGLGVEPLLVGHVWLPKMDKDDFVGKFALEHFAQRDEKEKLVGFTMEEDVVPAEGAQIVIEGLPAGRVTSARRSEAVGESSASPGCRRPIARSGTRVEIVVDRLRRGRGSHGAFYDPSGERMRS